MRDSSAVDFDDLLLMVVKLWKENLEILERYRERYRYVMVDEYQDTNLAQFEIVNLLAGGIAICAWWGMRTRASTRGAGRR